MAHATGVSRVTASGTAILSPDCVRTRVILGAGIEKRTLY